MLHASRDLHDDAPPTKPRAPDTPPSAFRSSVSSRSRRRRTKTNDAVQAATLDDDARKMLYGSLFSLKQFIAKLRPVGGARSVGDTGNQKAAQYYSFRTNNYKMHVRETAAGALFLLATEPGAGALGDAMRRFEDAWTECFAKNPVAPGPSALPSESTSAAFTARVEAIAANAGRET